VWANLGIMHSSDWERGERWYSVGISDWETALD